MQTGVQTPGEECLRSAQFPYPAKIEYKYLIHKQNMDTIQIDKLSVQWSDGIYCLACVALFVGVVSQVGYYRE